LPQQLDGGNNLGTGLGFMMIQPRATYITSTPSGSNANCYVHTHILKVATN